MAARVNIDAGAVLTPSAAGSAADGTDSNIRCVIPPRNLFIVGPGSEALLSH